MTANLLFEKIGKLLFQKNRIIIFLVILGLGPLISACFLYMQKQSLDSLQETSFSAMRRAKSAFTRKERKQTFLAKHENSDPYFLDKEIESMRFLEQEKELLKKWLLHPVISHKDKLAQRLHFLEGQENQLTFSEEEIQLSKTCKETKEKQRHSIEADGDDVKKLLAKIEEGCFESKHPATKGRPQLLICNFSMTKKIAPLQNEVFEITMDLLKREFLPK